MHQGLLLIQPKQRRKSRLVKPNDDFDIDDRHRCRRHSEAHEVLHCHRVLDHVAPLECNAVPGEELLDPAAEDSAGLIEDDDGPRHGDSLLIALNRPRPIRPP